MYEDVLVLGLDHVVTLGSQTRHVPVHVNLCIIIHIYLLYYTFITHYYRLLVLHPLEHGVDDDEGAGAADAGAAVRDDRAGPVLHRAVLLGDAPQELQEGRRVLRHAVVGPRRELQHLHLPPVRVTDLMGREKTQYTIKQNRTYVTNYTKKLLSYVVKC